MTSKGGAVDLSSGNPAVKVEIEADAVRSITSIPTYSEIAKQQKKLLARRNPYGFKKSRKTRYKSIRKPVRDNQHVYHARTMNCLFACAYMELPGVRAALAELRASRLSRESSLPEPEIIEIIDDEALEWPEDVRAIAECENPDEIRFPDVGDFDGCDCDRDCFRDTCTNALSSVFCTHDNCNRDGRCSNSVQECRDLQLVDRGAAGVGVVATATISVGAFLGEYAGVLTTHNFDLDHRQGDYALALQTRSTRRRKVFVDAFPCGSITRMMNHSCAATCKFLELRNRRQVKIMVVARRNIAAGEDVPVDYNTMLWFQCHCGAPNCVNRDRA